MQVVLPVGSNQDCSCWEAIHVWWRKPSIFRLHQQCCSWYSVFCICSCL